MSDKFLTPHQLYITQRQLNGLLLVLRQFEQGTLRHVRLTQINTLRHVRLTQINTLLSRGDYSGDFNMNWWCAEFKTQHRCGTVGCIGGTACMLMNDPTLYQTRTLSGELDNLFYPRCTGNYEDITAAHATRALRNYLTTGRADWEQVLVP